MLQELKARQINKDDGKSIRKYKKYLLVFPDFVVQLSAKEIHNHQVERYAVKAKIIPDRLDVISSKKGKVETARRALV
jgi:hypothetical protein